MLTIISMVTMQHFEVSSEKLNVMWFCAQTDL